LKIGDYNFTIGVKKDLSLADVLNSLQTIINNGRYQMRVVTAPPDWIGDDGEHLMYVNGQTRRLYIYDATNGTWHYLEWTGSGSINAWGDRILDDARTTGIFTQYVKNEQTLRFYINNLYVFSINAQGVSINSDFPISFDGLNGNTFMKYNSSTAYFEIWTDGVKRMEM